MPGPRIRYELVTDDLAPNIPIHGKRVFGSQRPFVAAVLTLHDYHVDDRGVLDPSGSATQNQKRWTVSRTSYTKLAAWDYRDRLRAAGYSSIVIPMRPAADQRQRQRRNAK